VWRDLSLFPPLTLQWARLVGNRFSKTAPSQIFCQVIVHSYRKKAVCSVSDQDTEECRGKLGCNEGGSAMLPRRVIPFRASDDLFPSSGIAHLAARLM
jgi:hypothetical protein